MQPNELKAVLSHTKEVAIKPVHVEIPIENQRVGKYGRRHDWGKIICPTNLYRATVIEDGAKWTEKRSVSSCGDQEYEIKRKNGVLVEIDPDDLPKGTFTIENNKLYPNNHTGNAYPHTEIVTRDGKQFIHLITSRKAIFASWGEYALEQARREKETADAEARNDALRNPQAALMGMTREEFDKKHVDNSSERDVYLQADWDEIPKRDKKGHVIYRKVTTAQGWSHEECVIEREIGRIQITVDQANKILNLLTPTQKKKLANG